MYYAVFFLLYVSLSFAILCLVTRAPVRRLLGPAALAALLALVLAWPLARTYSAARLGDRDVPTVTFYSATASDYLRAHTRSATWGERSLPDAKPERALFPGVMALLLAAIALVPPIGATRLAYAGALLLAFEISRGFNSPLYPYLYEWLPFLRGLRVPARCSLLVGLTLALLAGFGVRRMLAGRSPLVARVVLGVIVAAIGIDLRPKLQLEPVWLEPPPIYGGLANNRSVVLAEFPFGGHSQRFTPNVPYMYFSLWHWAQIINGYSGHYPEGHLEYEVEMQAFPEPRVVDLLRARGATHVSVNCELYRGGCEDLLAKLDGMSAFHLVASGRWRGQPVRLYQLQPPR
jgi:hypothetical protein